jgi:hypothetical protein
MVIVVLYTEQYQNRAARVENTTKFLFTPVNTKCDFL